MKKGLKKPTLQVAVDKFNPKNPKIIGIFSYTNLALSLKFRFVGVI